MEEKIEIRVERSESLTSAESENQNLIAEMWFKIKPRDGVNEENMSEDMWEVNRGGSKGRLRVRRKRRPRRRSVPFTSKEEWRILVSQRLRETKKQRAAELKSHSTSASNLLGKTRSLTHSALGQPEWLSQRADIRSSTSAAKTVAPVGSAIPSALGVAGLGLANSGGVHLSPNSSPRVLRRRKNSRPDSRRTSGATSGSRAPGLGSGIGPLGSGSGGKGNVSEESLHLHTLDEYSSAIFGDELSDWEDVVNFSDEEDELVDCPFTRRILGLDDDGDEFDSNGKRRRRNTAAEAAADLFSARRLQRHKMNWGGQGREFSTAPISPVDTEVHRNPLFMNAQAQGILVTRKKSWSVPTREDTLVKHVNPLFQNLILEAALQGNKKSWPQPPETPKRRLFPLRKMQSIPEMRPLHLPIKKAAEMKQTEMKTENPLYRKIMPR